MARNDRSARSDLGTASRSKGSLRECTRDKSIHHAGLRKRTVRHIKYIRVSTYRSKSVSLDESRKPFANGLLSIFSFVICNIIGAVD